jgi:23S rRNA (uracil1939-C5)-methyltransferase
MARKPKRGAPTAAQTGKLETLTLTDLAFGGEAIGRLDSRIVFVPFGLPGEDVVVELAEERRDFARGRIVEVLKPSPQRVQAPCPYYGECGGCSLQHADYSAQLEFKRQVIVEQLRRIGHFDDPAPLVRPTIGMLSPWEYRNHARFTVGRRFGELCFTRKATHQLMRIDRCLIMQPPINEAVRQIQGRLTGLPAHQVALRSGANTGDFLVNPALAAVPELPSGQQAIEEELFGRRFRIAAPAFFQVNTRREARPLPEGLRQPPWPLPADGLSMAEILVTVVYDRLELAGTELLVDAYSGVGAFTVLLASAVGRVIGVEESSAAVKDARQNAAGLSNVELIEGKTEDVLPRLSARPDAIVLDPARVGCDPAVLEAIDGLRVRRVVYVSCDPATLARDLAVLVARGFRLESVQPLDMFPQTYHVESVAALVRDDA